MKYAEIQAFSDPYFPVYGQNRICIFPYNYVFHLGHAAVAYFNVVFIEQLVKFVVSKKVVIN